MPSFQKKVILRRTLGDVLFGYLPPSGFVRDGAVSLLDPEGRLATVLLSDIKAIFFVRDFNRGDMVNPERLTRRSFLARPRGEGLWVRLSLRPDNDLLEGLAASDTDLLDGLMHDRGIHLTPPDSRSNTQRIFVPRSALSGFQVIAVITSPSRRRTADPTQAAAEDLQAGLFEETKSSSLSEEKVLP